MRSAQEIINKTLLLGPGIDEWMLLALFLSNTPTRQWICTRSIISITFGKTSQYCMILKLASLEAETFEFDNWKCWQYSVLCKKFCHMWQLAFVQLGDGRIFVVCRADTMNTWMRMKPLVHRQYKTLVLHPHTYKLHTNCLYLNPLLRLVHEMDI